MKCDEVLLFFCPRWLTPRLVFGLVVRDAIHSRHRCLPLAEPSEPTCVAKLSTGTAVDMNTMGGTDHQRLPDHSRDGNFEVLVAVSEPIRRAQVPETTAWVGNHL